jgi:hypothetical protein
MFRKGLVNNVKVRHRGRITIASRKRAQSLPLLSYLVVVGLAFGLAGGLPLAVPDTILLPDSLGPLRPPYHLAFGGSSWNIYVASESSDIIVVDGETFQRIKRINTGTPVGGALLVSQHNKLYCSYPMQLCERALWRSRA